MHKPISFLWSVIVIIAFSVVIGVYTIRESQKISNTQEDNSYFTHELDGIYSVPVSDPYNNATIIIASSTPDRLHFVVNTNNLGHGGYYSETAYKVASTSLVYVANKSTEDNNSLCIFTITFLDSNRLIYSTKDSSDDFNGRCRDNLGAHGSFYSDIVHVKNFVPPKMSIKQLGFSEEDIVAFDALIPNLIGEISNYLSPAETESEYSNHKKLGSDDVKNSLVYSIDTPNIYSGTRCYYASPSGYCVFAVFMKDDAGHYWIMGGNTYDLQKTDSQGFLYATNDPAWENRLPDVFKEELARIGLDESNVLKKPVKRSN